MANEVAPDPRSEGHTEGFPEQEQEQPGLTTEMEGVKPDHGEESYMGSGRLEGMKSLITGGDSGIGRAVAIAFAREGADVAIIYQPEEQEDAEETKRWVEEAGRKCLLLPGDLRNEEYCADSVGRTVQEFGGLDIVVLNAAFQDVQDSIADLDTAKMDRTFKTNLYGHMWITRSAVPQLIDYAMTKAALVAFTQALAQELAEKGVRVNSVAPGPIWTPLIPATFDAKHVAEFGKNVPMGRAGQPNEVAPAFLFLACEDSSYFTGQVLHPNGGEMVNG